MYKMVHSSFIHKTDFPFLSVHQGSTSLYKLSTTIVGCPTVSPLEYPDHHQARSGRKSQRLGRNFVESLSESGCIGTESWKCFDSCHVGGGAKA